MLFRLTDRPVSACAFLVALMAASPVMANEYAPQIQRFVEQKIRPWLRDPAIVDALRKQNAEHAGLDQAGIESLDATWRSEAEQGDGPMIRDILSRPISKILVQRKAESGSRITEMFLMDDRGLNVGQSDITSDYWQGDEAKWQKTYQAGADAMFIDDIEFDDSTEMFQSQVSVSVADPETGKAIGAITVGLNIEQLE